jgi:hypothetical protein
VILDFKTFGRGGRQRRHVARRAVTFRGGAVPQPKNVKTCVVRPTWLPLSRDGGTTVPRALL